MDSPIVGIDLGTTFTVASVFEGNDSTRVIFNHEGDNYTPSWVSFVEGEVSVGNYAKRHIITAPDAGDTVYGIKRLIGRAPKDPKALLDITNFPFQVNTSGQKMKIEIHDGNDVKSYAPEEVSAMVLKYMKNAIEENLEKRVTRAVITVPAYFSQIQRQCTEDAGKIAGFEIVGIVNEPTAAAFAYGFDKQLGHNENILVYDLGGGTFDVTIVNVKQNHYQVLAINGDPNLGGDDFDNKLIDYFAEDFQKKHGIYIKNNKSARVKLRNEAERAKQTLTNVKKAKFEIPNLANNITYRAEISRATFEHINHDLFHKTIKLTQDLLKNKNLEPSEINRVILVGGSTRIPKIQEMVKELFGGLEPLKSINPDEAVARGAAIMAAMEVNQLRLTLSDALPVSLGVDAIIHGVEGVMSIVIPRNTSLPCKRADVYCTNCDNQASCSFPIYEGESDVAVNNTKLDEIILENLPLKPKGEVTFDVEFEIHNDGILHVTATETSRGISDSRVMFKHKLPWRLSTVELGIATAGINNIFQRT